MIKWGFGGLIILLSQFVLFSCMSIGNSGMNADIDNSEADRPILSLETGGHLDRVNGLCFTPDNKIFITASADKTIRLWDMKTGNLLRVIRGFNGSGRDGAIMATDLSPDGSLLAVSVARSEGSVIRLISIPEGEVVANLYGHQDQYVETVCFSPDGNYLASGGIDSGAILWNVKEQKLESRINYEGHTSIFEMDFSPDGSLLAIAAAREAVFLWSVAQKRVVKIIEGHNRPITSVSFTADGNSILTTGFDGSARLWNTSSGELIRVVEETGSMNTWLNAGDLIQKSNTAIVGRFNGNDKKRLDNKTYVSVVRLYNLDEGVLQTSLYTPYNGNSTVNRICVSPDGRFLAAAIEGNSITVGIWDLRSEEMVHSFNSTAYGTYPDVISEEFFHSPNFNSRQQAAANFTVSKSLVENNTVLLISKGDKIVKIVDGKTGGGFTTFCVTPDGSEVIAGTIPGIIYAFSMPEGKLLREYKGNTGWIHSLMVSADGNYLLSKSNDHTRCIWNSKTGELLVTFFSGENDAWACWTPQGFYNSSLNGDKFIGWQVNNDEFLPAEFYLSQQFRRYLYRPDVVSASFALGSARMAVENAGLNDVTIDELIKRAPVSIEIVSVDKIDSSKVRLNMRLVENQTTIPERITIFNNGAQQLNEDQRKLEGLAPGAAFSREIEISSNINKITVLVENQWAEGRTEYQYEALDFIETHRLPKLTFIGVGINRYPQLPPDQQLMTPDRDVAELAAKMESLEGVLYDDVVVETLSGRDLTITIKMVNDFLTERINDSKPEDITIFFLAGHGITDKKGNYQFVTSDTQILDTSLDDNLELENSFLWSDLHHILDRTMGKRVVIVDTCDAGSVLNTSVFDFGKLEKEIHDVNAIVFAGSSRQEVSLEDDEGGIFTQAILKGVGDYENYKDQNLTITSLGKFVSSAVPLETQDLLISQYRGLKVKQKESENSDELSLILQNIQTPKLTIPEGMENFIFYRLEAP